MKNKKFIIAANWKMNPQSLSEAKKLFSIYKRLAKKYETYQFVVATPSVFLHSLGGSKALPNNLKLSAENVYIHDNGSYTGAISVPMVTDAGASATLIGHSERRNIFGVSDDLISKKVAQCVSHKLPMIACFGEAARDESGSYVEELEQQLQAITAPLQNTKQAKLLTLAYEPVWAIGKDAKRPITEDELFSTMLLIKNILHKQLGEKDSKKIKVLYGGSVNEDNAAILSATPGVDGFLIGRAGLDPERIALITKNV